MSFASDPAIDAAYAPRRALPPGQFEAHMDLYRDRSAEAYLTLPNHRDLRYDPASGQCLDIFPAPGPGLKPVFVFIHGGYWRMLGKSDSVFMAPVFTRRGISVVAPDYALAPDATLEEIVRQVRASTAWLYRNGPTWGIDPDRIFVGGSSAGGHLAAALVSAGWRETVGLPEDLVKGAMPVSGLFDLVPITKSFVNEWLGLDAVRARAMSPIFHLPQKAGRQVVAWGAEETSGFKEQSRDYLRACRGAGLDVQRLEIPGRHHFDVVLDWCDPDSTMTDSCAAMILG